MFCLCHRKAKNKILSDSEKSDKSDAMSNGKSDSLLSIKLSTSDSSSWDSEVVKPKTKRKKANSDSSISIASSTSSIKKK